MRYTLVCLLMLGGPVQAAQLGCPGWGYTLGEHSYEQVVQHFGEEHTRFQESDEGLSCAERFRMLIVFAPIKCEALPLMAIGSGLIFAEDTRKLVSVGLMFPYQPGFHAALLKGLRKDFTELSGADIPAGLEQSETAGVQMTAVLRNEEVIVSLERPADGARGAPMSTVTYMLPRYVALARQDMKQCGNMSAAMRSNVRVLLRLETPSLHQPSLEKALTPVNGTIVERSTGRAPKECTACA
jgi:hypothetical protein